MKKQTQLSTLGYIVAALLLLFGTNVFGQPAAPTALVATPGNTSVSIALTAPAGTILNYEWSFDNGTTWVARSPVSSTLPIIIDGVQTDTTHSVLVRAIDNTNAVGTASAPVVFTTGALTAPLELEKIVGNQTLTITFKEPVNDGGNGVTSYQYTTNAGTSWTTVALSSVTNVPGTAGRKSFTIASLTNGTTYTVVIRAVNALGAGESSASIQGTPATVPTAPAITLLAPTNDGFVVTFNSPSTNGGQAITNYQYSVDNGTTWATASPTVTTSPLTIEGLDQGTLYRVRVRAVNSIGSGAGSTSTQGTTHALTAPTNLTATVGSTSLTLQFTAPTSSTAGAVTDYEYTLNNGTTWVSTGSTSSTFTVTGLTNGTVYTVRVRAINIGGKGLVSTGVTAIPRNATTLATIQFFHNANIGTVNVLVDEDELVEDFVYQTGTDLLTVDAGREIEISVVKGDSTYATLTTTLTLNKTYQVFVVGGTSGKPVEFVVTDVVRTASTVANQVQYRFIHGITSTDKVTLERVSTSTPRQPIQQIALNQTYKGISSFAGTNDLGYTTLQLTSNNEILGRFLFNLGEFEGNVVTFVGTGVVGSTLNVLGFNADGSKIPSTVTTSDNDTGIEVPAVFTLYSNYPNPFNPTTNIKFDLPESAIVKIQVVDVLGRQVMEMNGGSLTSGQKVLTLDASNLSSGIYYYKVIAQGSNNTYTQSSKFTLVK